MYSKTNIAKLSKAQISKLLKGNRVRIKSGTEMKFLYQKNNIKN